jgi:methylphosphotriester-DNA--protein-cysteine methyltransferase
MMKLSYDEMLGAMMTDDSRYDGVFYVCVRSTGIYCLPSCKAKDPLLKNVVFHRSKEEAVAQGFRGCLRCRSEFFPDIAPGWLPKVIRFMNASFAEKVTERELAKAAGVDSSTIRRYFKVYMETTPMAYLRKLKLEHARELLQKGNDYLTTAFECGYSSASGFREAFHKQFGISPGKIYGAQSHHL